MSPTSTGPFTRRKSRASFATYDGAADDEQEAKEKGGHSLRKRTRIDYTQEMANDAVSTQEPKLGVTKKTAPASAVQQRKRGPTHDLSDDDSDDTAVAAKRRRVEKETPGPRATTSRRKSTTRRQPPPGPPPPVQQQSSDNDVKDTIMVGVSMEELDDSYPSSSQSSSNSDPSRHESPPAPHSGGSLPEVLDTAQPSSPSKESNKSRIPDVAAVTQTNDSHISNDLNQDSPDRSALDCLRKNQTTPRAPAAAEQPDVQPHSSETAHVEAEDDVTRIKEEELPPFTSSARRPLTEDSPLPSKDTGIGASAPSQILEGDINNVSRQESTGENVLAAEAPGYRASPLLEATAQSPPQPPQPKSHGPQLLPQLKPIYEAAEQQSYCAKLAPYEDGEVILPVSWTEIIYPIAKPGTNTTPTATGASTPQSAHAPQDASAPEHWPKPDLLKTMTHKEFFAHYRTAVAYQKQKGLAPPTMREVRDFFARQRALALAAQERALAEDLEMRNQQAPAERDINEAAVETSARPKKARKAARGKRSQAKTLTREAGTPVLETPRASPAPDSQPPTAAPSPEPAEMEAIEPFPAEDGEPDGEPEIELDPSEVSAERVVPLQPEVVTRFPKKQYVFKKLPDSTGFEEALEDLEEQDDETLRNKLASAATTLQAYQAEYNELRKITDDEDNARRRLLNDKAIENWDARLKLDEPPVWRRTFTDLLQKVPPFFEVKGVRAPKPYVDDPEEEHQRQEDMIMAQAYGFSYDNDRRHIGRQNPETQRWDMSENRLRERKQTKKAADAAEEAPVVEGKRIRKPRILGDQSVHHSRAPTPVPATRPRRNKRGAQVEEQPAGTELPGASLEMPVVSAAEPAPDSKSSTKKRAPRGKAKTGTVAADKALNGSEVPATVHDSFQSNGSQEPSVFDQAEEQEIKNIRKRARPATTHRLATATIPSPDEDLPAEEESPPKPKRQRKTKDKAATPQPGDNEIPSTSFYGKPAQSAASYEPEDYRPSTSSSNGTVHTAATAESAYSLRDKKPRNFAEENDPALGARKRTKPAAAAEVEETVQAPPKKTVRHIKKPKSKVSKIKVMNHASASQAKDDFVQASEDATSPSPVLAGQSRVDNAAAAATPSDQPLLLTFSSKPGRESRVYKKPRIKLINKGDGSDNPNAYYTGAPHPPFQPSPVPDDGMTTTAEGSENGSAEPEKPYAEMSKSEKMSYSMKRKLTHSFASAQCS